MKKVLVLTAISCAAIALAPASVAGSLVFNQAIAECENKWFGAEAEGGGVILGYVYVDPSAGFTFEHYGTLEDAGGALRAVQSDLAGKARLIHRIDRNFPATCLGEGLVAELGLPTAPETMKFYKDDRPPAEHHAAWAYHYNHIGASDIALDHVSKAIAAGATSKDLTFEHAFALNVLERYDETIALLDPLVTTGNMTSDIIAELAYARLMQGEYQVAIDLYKKAIDHSQGERSSRRWEFARNIAAAYEELGDEKQRDAWFKRSNQLRESRK